jgi:hypothetical protein
MMKLVDKSVDEVFISMKPYVYKLVGQNSEYYFGVRWNYKTEPENDLLVNYFTSSETIKKMMLEYGVNYFVGEILNIFDDKESALDYEYNLIKNSINDINCLNKAMGKCTIWDDELKKRLSGSIKKLFDNPKHREMHRNKSVGENNHNYKLKPWRNINSDVESWKVAIKIYDDYIFEKWDLTKYGFGRFYLIKRYKIKQGSARRLISLLREGWNPYNDKDYLDFMN